MNLYLVQYNNYFNRIVKKEETLEDYLTGRNYDVLSSTNFNPADGVDTTHVINWKNDFFPDYLIAVSEDNEIVSRWFITDMPRIRNGQYDLKLHRDVIVDNFDTVVNAPCFVEKGYVDKTSNLIFNDEGFNCNQIKTSESLLYDNTRCSWLVLYYNLSKKADLKGTNVPLDISESLEVTEERFNELTAIEGTGYKLPTDRQFKIRVAPRGGRTYRYRFNSQADLEALEESGVSGDLFRSLEYNSDIDRLTQQLVDTISSNKTSITSALSQYKRPTVSFDTLVFYNGKIIKTSSNLFYKVSFKPISSGNVEIQDLATTDNLYTTIINTFNQRGGWVLEGSQPVEGRLTYTEYSLTLTPVDNDVATFNFDFTNCKDITDQPFGIIALPYKSYNDKYIQVRTTSALLGYELDERVSLAIFKELTKAGTGADKPIYDAQLLPYCPLANIVGAEGRGSVTISMFDGRTQVVPEENFKVISANSTGTDIGLAIFPNTCKFTKNIKFEVDVEEDSKEFKLNSQTDFVRLCSPNYNGQFEFNVYKNRGLSYFNVDCTYKPYQPYIHVNPDFKGLYGSDFNDPRGLVCGGDFSMTIVSDAWESYKLQNKNYQEIFNRQIENMDTMNSIARTQAIVGAIGGAIPGGGSGGLTGAMIGGSVGGIIGGSIGAAASLGAGIADYSLLKKQQAEQRDYTIDIHEYQLGNIKALPDTLSKVDAFNNNNKIFPVLEFYSCTEEEKEIFKTKIRYDGMSINAIGTLSKYKNPVEETFVKGQLIRLEINEDAHMAGAIYNEIAKGVYL